MANRTVLLCLLILCTSLYVTECGRFSSRGGGSRGGGSSWGKGWGGSSSSSNSGRFGSSSGSSYKPSYSWNTGSSSSGNSYKPSYSWNTGSSSSGSHTYPGSSSLSGTGGGSKHTYPNSPSLSGTGSGSHSYPPSPSLSGSGSRGTSGLHTYPGSTLSGSGSGNGRHTYPTGPALSGSGTGGTHYGGSYNRPVNTYHTNSGYGEGSYVPKVTYYHYPQHVYVSEYRHSGSRYGDLLTGLTWYNLGRSQSHYHDHYYYDDYYQRWHGTPNSPGYIAERRPDESATCTLRITENGRLEVLKIPCAIVSTFTADSQKVSNPQESYVNTTVCTTNTTVILRTAPVNVSVGATSSPILVSTDKSNSNITSLNNTNMIITNATAITQTTTNITVTPNNVTSQNVTLNQTITEKPMYYIDILDRNNINLSYWKFDGGVTFTDNKDIPKTTLAELIQGGHATKLNMTANVTSITEKPIIEDKNITEGDTTTRIIRVITTTEETRNVTVCTTMTDPLSVKGAPINPAAMKCEVDIKTNDGYFRNKVDCTTLMNYSKTPPPKKESSILPEREKLKSWLQKPPWWMSMFIAV